MALRKTPVTGMKDILPDEMELRDYLISIIKKNYTAYGFTPIETPVVEHIENLSSKQGGDNEKLIFKILKRGEKLKLDGETLADDLSDSGLRYDLTLPLARFYANNAAELPVPFKALQIGPVFRADRPQKGRFRQFYQCDIDILGEPSSLAEIELIAATGATLLSLHIDDFIVKVNDRNLLSGMALAAGFALEDIDGVLIILDKLDKIGFDGVLGEFMKSGYDETKAKTYLSFFEKLEGCADWPSEMRGILKNNDRSLTDNENEAIHTLSEIIDSVSSSAGERYKVNFDPTLVRGMSYYTGTIFEIATPSFGGSIAGGGRYDKMIGKFVGTDTPACGFSIGFERIIVVLRESGFMLPSENPAVAVLLDKGLSSQERDAALLRADGLRRDGAKVLVVTMKKNKKFQKEQLEKFGYHKFEEIFAGSTIQ